MSGTVLVDRYADATPAQVEFLKAATAELMGGQQTSAGVADPSGGAGGTTSGETLAERIERRRAAAGGDG